MKELKEKLIACGVDEKDLYLHDGDKMFVNCADTQLVKKTNGVYSFHTVGGSRYFYLERFTSAEDCAKFIMKFYVKTREQINEEYRNLAAKIGL